MVVPGYVTREDVASRGGCGREQIDAAIRLGELAAVRIGIRIFIPETAAEEWLQPVPVPIVPTITAKSKAS